MLTILALIVATIALIVACVAVYQTGALQKWHSGRHKAIVRAIAKLSGASHRVDDRLTYYERRPDGLKNLRAGYDKQIAKIAKQRAEADDAAPEGTAQAEHLVG